MKISEVLTLIDKSKITLNRTDRQLEKCHSLDDFERLASRKLPRPIFDYLQGGADREVTLANNVNSFRRWGLVPLALNDVSNVDLTTKILGREHALPIGLSPTGYTRMFSAGGEYAVAAAAMKENIPYTLSTMGTTSIQNLAKRQPDPHNLWFQLYVLNNRKLTEKLVHNALQANYHVLEVAIDTSVSGNRLRDRRNGLTIPPKMALTSVLDIATKPGYWTRLIREPALQFANLEAEGSGGGSIAGLGSLFDASLSWDDIAWLRREWPGPLLLKGLVSPSDAVKAREIGVDGIHLSNHGGRQLDQAVAPIDLLGPVREAVGSEFTLLVDSGLRSGVDVAIALALGADAAFIGRPYLWGLTIGGEKGVALVIQTLRDELMRTMQLLGVASVEELKSHGTQLLRHAI
jgi:L-lactate dehydrogenase (cytochrome)